MADTPRGETSTETLKQRALIRLAAAGAVTVAALVGLWWLDKSGKPPPEHKPAPPAPIVTAPKPAPPPEPRVPEPVAPAEVPAAQPEPKPAPPPPQVSNFSAAPPAGLPAPPAPRPAVRPETQARPAPPAPAPEAVERGFVLQLGVFSNPDNAKQLVQRLNREGIRAYSETRVQVGPFQSREEAEKARLALERLGIRAVISPQGATR